MNVYEYVMAPTGTIHLAHQGATPSPTTSMTLCERPIRSTWELGDETPSGIAATCRTCRKRVQS